ncbi:MAG: M24 family metallopeptidase [Chloroflexi bacterium]|nr:M24 family metallopeptidase [Chloroflexota bacterium]
MLAAQTAVLQHTTPGMKATAVDALARDLIKEAGYGDYFGHGLGHGLGLFIHEAPFMTHLPRGEKIQPGNRHDHDRRTGRLLAGLGRGAD